MKPAALPDDAIARELVTLPGWRREGTEIVRTFDRGNFDGAIGFTNAVAVEANRADHHPDLIIRWNEVTVRLSSHDAGGLTPRDFALARTIDSIAAR